MWSLSKQRKQEGGRKSRIVEKLEAISDFTFQRVLIVVVMLHRGGTIVRVPTPLLVMGRVVLLEPLVFLRCDALLRVGEHVQVHGEGEVVVHLIGGGGGGGGGGERGGRERGGGGEGR
jgi:hypothetical protein